MVIFWSQFFLDISFFKKVQLKAEVTWDLSQLTSSSKEHSGKASFEFVKCLQEQVKFKKFINLQSNIQIVNVNKFRAILYK